MQVSYKTSQTCKTVFLTAGLGTEVSFGTMGKKSLEVLPTIVDAPTGSVRLPWSMDCVFVLPCSSASCHQASLGPLLLFENMDMYKTVPCLLQLERWTKQNIANVYTAQNLSI